MSSLMPSRFAQNLLTDALAAATLKIMYLQSSLTPLSTHKFVADVVAAECNVAGYSRQTLVNLTATEDVTGKRSILNSDDPAPQTLAAGNTIGHAVVFDQQTNDADSPIWGFLKVTKVTDGTAFAPIVSPSGLLRFQAG